MDFRVLGPVRVHAGGRTVPIGEPRRQAVFSVLLLEAGRTVADDMLIDRVWGETPPQQARRSLQAHITRIRRALEEAEPGGALVARDSGGYRLAVKPEQVDVFRFRRALHEHTADAAALEAALALWHGEPLAGVRGDWAERTRRTLRQDHAAAVVAWAEAKINAGEAASTIGRLTALSDEYPLQETAAAALMRALYAANRGADALAHYERIRLVLREELGADPGPELAAVHEAVLRHDLPPQGASSPVPAQLPADVAAFAGRTEELAELDRVTTGLVCLTGTAGAGKTATAVHWGHRVRSRFPDGQLYLDLRGYEPGEPMPSTDALATFLDALLPDGARMPLMPVERAARFRTEVAGKRMLIVLDNAATAEQVRPLLPGTHTCVVVVTSRDSLAGLVALHGAHRVTVDRLPAADAVGLLRRLIGPRVDAEPEATAELAERCVRLPLTLRLAAELAGSRPGSRLSRLVDELRAAQSTLDLLSGGGDQRAAVRAVFSWSLRQLSEEAIRAFALLGHHPAPLFDAYALAALSGDDVDQAQADLDALARANLVHPAGVYRYGMHELLKAYAAEIGDEPALSRVYDYYLATIAAAMDRLYPAEAHRRPAVAAPAAALPAFDDAAARDWLDAESPNVQALAAHAAGHGMPEHAVTLSSLLFRYLDGHRETAALAIHGYAKEAARILGDHTAEATALIALGAMHMQAGRTGPAAADMWAAHALFRETGDLLGQARAVGNVGMLEESAGRYRRAAAYYTRALTMLGTLGDVTGQAHMLTRLGTIEARIGRDEPGHEHLRRAMALHRRAGHRFGEAWAKIGLGELATRQHRTADARRLHSEAADLFSQLGHRGSEAWAIDGLGRAEASSGHPVDAATHHRRALDLFRVHSCRDGESWALNGLGEACHACGYVATARANHTEALAVATRTGCHEQVARAYHGLARAASSDTDFATARSHYGQAIEIYTELGLTEAEVAKAELTALR
ncbi:AfsR/SARP family transcriptional regulator [Amycolatopsis xylanica]|uniref:AfsR/SARP family transcriptional regulator n=1 Tax=Amycolatopsis xylanica TaxID=589385 RepID=UPI000B8979EE|nr:BTAD domain-containing putative transcriptional regulator [Amycolatopsis xylanica]